jgi:polysaccharide biosynthesis/export protein
MSSRLVALTAMSTLLLGACAHDGGGSIFDQLRGGVPTIAADDHQSGAPVVHVGTHQSWGEPTAVPVGLVGPKAVASTDGPYLLDTGDRLRVFVYGQPNLSRLYSVDHDGRITVPLIGAVKARGQTTTALESSIRSRLGSQFVKDPQVTVDVQQNRPFFILGEVRTAGQYPYVSGMTIETAVAIAGGYSERANERRARITRRIDGLVDVMEVPPDYVVQAGDTVYVYERFF